MHMKWNSLAKAFFALMSLAGLAFAICWFLASVSVIGLAISSAVGYGLAVFMAWLVFEALGRFGGERLRRSEPWMIMAFFLVVYVVFMFLVPELGQRRMPYDSLRAQKSLEAGHIAFFRPQRLYYWINYDLVLSILGKVFAPKLIVGQMLNAICRVLALYPVFRLGERVAGRRMARFTAILLAMSPTLTLYSSTLVGDFIAAMFYLYAAYFFLTRSKWDGLSGDNLVLWCVVGMLAGLGYVFKSISILFFAALIAWMVKVVFQTRRRKVAVLALLALFVVGAAHEAVKKMRTRVIEAAGEIAKVDVNVRSSLAGGLLYEIWMGMSIHTGGWYSPQRDKAFGSAAPREKVEMVRKMLVDDMGKFPEFLVWKFKVLWGSNDSPGSILYWFRTSCQDDCYDTKAPNHCVAWLQPLLRAEHLFFSIVFLLGAGGLFISMRKQGDSQGTGIVSIMMVLSFAALSLIIETQGRYRTAIYPFFFLILPYAHFLFMKGSPLRARIAACLRKGVAALERQDAAPVPSQEPDAVPSEESETLKVLGEVSNGLVANRGRVFALLAWTTFGILLYLVSVAAVTTMIDVGIDYPTHIKLASRIAFKSLLHPFAFLKENCYPVWHVLTWLTMKVFGCGGRSAAAVVTGGCVVGVWAYAAVYFSRKWRDGENGVAWVASACLILAAPIWLPFFNPNIMLGQGSPNLLQSPTHLMVRLAAFPCFVWYAAIMNDIGRKPAPDLGVRRFVVPSLFVLLATFSKPSFMQMFFPAMFLLAVAKMIKYGRAAIRPVAAVAVSLAPAFFLVCLQTWVSFYSSHAADSGVGIAFLKVYSHYSPNVFVSIMLGILFPLIVLLWGMRARKLSTADALAWIMYGVALLQGALLIEKGRRMWHANFTWATNLALFLLWFTSIDRFVSLAKEYVKAPADSEQKWWFWSAVGGLSLHVVSGLCYLWRVLVLGIWV